MSTCLPCSLLDSLKPVERPTKYIVLAFYIKMTIVVLPGIQIEDYRLFFRSHSSMVLWREQGVLRDTQHEIQTAELVAVVLV